MTYTKDGETLLLEKKLNFIFLDERRIINIDKIIEFSVNQIDDETFVVEGKLSSLSTSYLVTEECKPTQVSSPESLEIETFCNEQDALDFIKKLFSIL